MPSSGCSEAARSYVALGEFCCSSTVSGRAAPRLGVTMCSLRLCRSEGPGPGTVRLLRTPACHTGGASRYGISCQSPVRGSRTARYPRSRPQTTVGEPVPGKGSYRCDALQRRSVWSGPETITRQNAHTQSPHSARRRRSPPPQERHRHRAKHDVPSGASTGPRVSRCAGRSTKTVRSSVSSSGPEAKSFEIGAPPSASSDGPSGQSIDNRDGLAAATSAMSASVKASSGPSSRIRVPARSTLTPSPASLERRAALIPPPSGVRCSPRLQTGQDAGNPENAENRPSHW